MGAATVGPPAAPSPHKPRLPARVKAFSIRYPWLGPLVWIASLQYFVAQIVVGWVWKPPYSVIANTISDLGNTTCGLYGKLQVCSPRHAVMNASFVLLGITMAVGSLLIYQEFSERGRGERVAAVVGFSGMAIAGLGTIMVGIFPENQTWNLHAVGAGLAIGVGNLAILVLGAALRLPSPLRRSMVALSLIALAALILFASHRDFGVGPGGMERIAAYPETIWLIRFGLYIAKPHFPKRRSLPLPAPPSAA